jgi:hypothetical protein
MELLGQRGLFFSSDFRPPPRRRTRSCGTGSDPTSSRRPWRMVVRLMPVIVDSSVLPPWPFIDARSPTTRRACFSSRPAIARRTFRCSVASVLLGCALHISHLQVELALAMPAEDHAAIPVSIVQVIEIHLLSVPRSLLRAPNEHEGAIRTRNVAAAFRPWRHHSGRSLMRRTKREGAIARGNVAHLAPSSMTSMPMVLREN